MKFIVPLFFISVLIVSCESNSDTGETSSETQEQSKEVLIKEEIPPVVEVSRIPKMNADELRLARNILFAKYGRVFNSPDLKAYFNNQKWYKENPGFKEADLKDDDRALIELISLWENKTKVLFNEQIDLSGNGSYENCAVLYNKNRASFAVVINDQFKEFKHYWGKFDQEKPPSNWTPIHVKTIDIDPDDFRKEIHIHQRFNDWVDPGTENLIITFDTEIRVTELSSTNYDAGKLTFNNDATVTMQFSNCPDHKRDYKLKDGKLIQFDETIGPMPRGGCAACFTENAQVATSISSALPISQLQAGDEVLSYDVARKKLEVTKIARVLAVFHDELALLSFGNQSLEVTKDHPFYVNGKGWSSLEPERTKQRYQGYAEVQLLEVGDRLQAANGETFLLNSIKHSDEGKMTYTIESLENGKSYIVNGIVVGSETKITAVP